MKRIDKTVFVSYRHDHNEAWALSIFQDLTQRGYDVFIDYDSIGSGNFETIILENIRARAHFLVLLTPTALQRCADPKDWMRREIESALDSQRNIVPVMLEGFHFSETAIAGLLTGKLAALKERQGVEIPRLRSFSSEMERLRNKFLDVPVDAILQLASDFAQQAASEQKEKATAAATATTPGEEGSRSPISASQPEPQPFQQTSAIPMATPRRPSASDTEFNIANREVEKALQDLAFDEITQDWAESIRTTIAESKVAAAAGFDPTNRDTVIAMRRQLGEYARMARFVGSMSPETTKNFRRLGRALDIVSAVLLVMLGESLAGVGFATGSYLLQVPLPELQQRRDAVITALRNFDDDAQQAYRHNDSPRGIGAYRRLYKWLEDQGRGDLRPLLVENQIARTMDALITRARSGAALGVTTRIDIERFRQMAIVASGALADGGHVDRSQPLEAYLQALNLFAETFKPAGGLGLLRIARPAILYDGLYRTSRLEQDNALFDLVAVRGTFAMIFDGLFPNNVARGVVPQVLLDMLLLELDRGIDLLALGSGAGEAGPNEWRTYALWAIIAVILDLLTGQYLASAPRNQPTWWQPYTTQVPGPIADRANGGDKHFANELMSIYYDFTHTTNLVPGFGEPFERFGHIPMARVPNRLDTEMRKSVVEELQVQMALENRWENLLRTIATEAEPMLLALPLPRMVIEQAAYDLLDGKPLPMRS